MTNFYFVVGRIASFTTTSFDSPSFTNSIDLQEPISVTLKNFLSANWPTQSILKSSQIKFGTKWYDDYGSFQIHCRESRVPERPIMLTWQYTYVSHFIDVHVWVRKNIHTQPPELDDMKRSISSIIQINRVNFPITVTMSNFIRVMNQFDIPDNQPLQSIWHSVIQVEIRYWKATSN